MLSPGFPRSTPGRRPRAVSSVPEPICTFAQAPSCPSVFSGEGGPRLREVELQLDRWSRCSSGLGMSVAVKVSLGAQNSAPTPWPFHSKPVAGRE